MMFQVKSALSAEELTEINDALEDQNYVDGRETAANAASLACAIPGFRSHLTYAPI